MILGEPPAEEMIYTSLSEARTKPLEVYNIKLDYQVVDLGQVPWERFRNLRTLSLRHCQLTKLPQVLGQLPRLEVLNLGANPELDWVSLLLFLQELPQLGHLVLDSCAQTFLPENIGNLAKLRQLNIHSNRLYELPASLWQLPRLRFLDASGNLIRDLPWPETLKAPLQEVELSLNLLDAIPWPLVECPQLEKLYLDYTNIREISGWLPERDVPVRVFLRGNAMQGVLPKGEQVIWVLE